MALAASLAVAVFVGCAADQTAPTPTYTAPMSLPGGAQASGQIALAAVEPNDGVAPVVRFIQSATTSIDIVIYQFDPGYKALVDPLLAAQHSGVNVRILLSRQLFGPELTSRNVEVRRKFRSMGLNAQLSRPGFTYTHQKTIIADAGTASARALICDFNFEPGYFGQGKVEEADFATSGQTRGMAVLDSDPADVATMAAMFAADWPPYEQWPASTRPNLVWSPSGVQFNPRGNSIEVLTSLVESAQQSIDVYALMVELPSVMYQPILDRARAGVKVRIVSNKDGITPEAVRGFRAAGVQISYNPQSTDGSQRRMFVHSKSIVVDGETPSAVAFVGSQNPFLAESLDSERELGALLTEAASIEKIMATFDRDFSTGSQA